VCDRIVYNSGHIINKTFSLLEENTSQVYKEFGVLTVTYFSINRYSAVDITNSNLGGNKAL
jgi:hypothetical protein